MKYIDSEKLIAEIERLRKECASPISVCNDILSLIDELQQEQPMPDSTQLIEFWNEDKEILKEKDFRDDAWRLAYNAFMRGFVRGISVKRQEQTEVRLEREIDKYFLKWEQGATDEGCFNADSQLVSIYDCHRIARHFYELGLNARKEK